MDANEPDKITMFCQWPDCNLESDIIYLGKGLCDKHWVKSCDMPTEKVYKKLKIKAEEK